MADSKMKQAEHVAWRAITAQNPRLNIPRGETIFAAGWRAALEAVHAEIGENPNVGADLIVAVYWSFYVDLLGAAPAAVTERMNARSES